jgi:signal transduction histidine kinase
LHRMSNEANAACHNLPFTSANCVSGGLLTISQEPKDTDVALPGNDNFISYLVEETAHRVRNPLTVVKGFVQLYRDNPQDIPWDLILDEVSGIERTLQDLMIFSHNYRPKPERINLNQVVAELFPGTEVIARQQGVWVELYLDRSPVNVIADSERIATLVNQLILNSLHAMPEGGILTIRTVSNKSMATLQVTDSGAVDMEMRSREGNQLNPGFRLAICEHMVKNLGGNIDYYRAKNKGTIVTVTIPRITG